MVDDVAPQFGRALGPGVAAAVIAVTYPRLPTGARATLAIVCGGIAVVAAAADGGQHLTALVAGVAGAVMAVEGVRRLWGSRRRDGHWAVRRSLLSLAAVVGLYFMVLPLAFAVLATQGGGREVASADLGRPYERVTLRTRDGLRLAAWSVPSRNGAAVIVFPGRVGPVRQARLLARHGYGVLLLDRRGEGGSDGELNRFGWNGEGDLRAALDFLAPKTDRIGGLGLSVGGELLLQRLRTTRAFAPSCPRAPVCAHYTSICTPRESAPRNGGRRTGWCRRSRSRCCRALRHRLILRSSASGSALGPCC